MFVVVRWLWLYDSNTRSRVDIRSPANLVSSRGKKGGGRGGGGGSISFFSFLVFEIETDDGYDLRARRHLTIDPARLLKKAKPIFITRLYLHLRFDSIRQKLSAYAIFFPYYSKSAPFRSAGVLFFGLSLSFRR